MTQPAIKVESLSKRYRIGLKEEMHDTFAGALTSFVRSPFKNLRRLRRLSRLGDGESDDIIWALKDVSFEVQPGEVVGIIGRNGAGKSTLLKILSRITRPTAGRVTINGRVSSLLEVGTGFHPELTGRENIYLNGTILGMRKAEIDRKFDQIVDFSGVEQFIDTPVKRYSSGMSVRLAFSVAAHLEPEILLIDEVLAVGDIEFQRKCLGKMGKVAGEGRTVLFVSHNIGMIRALCPRSLMFDHGAIQIDADTEVAIQKYLTSAGIAKAVKGERYWNTDNAPGTKVLKLRWLRLLNTENEASDIFDLQKPIHVEIGFEVYESITGLRWIVQIKTQEGIVAFSSTDHIQRDGRRLLPSLYRTSCFIPSNLLNQGVYYLSAHAGIPGVNVLVQGQDWLSFSTIGESAHGSFYKDSRWPGVVAPKLEWTDDEVVDFKDR